MWSYARRGARVPSLEGAGSGAGSSTQPCDWSGVLYTVGLVDAPRLMPIRPRLTRPPRILIASDQNHALSDVVRSLGRRGYSVLRVKLDRYVLVKVERDGVSRRDLVDDVTGLYSMHGLARRTGELILQAAQHNTSVACVAVAPARDGEERGVDGLDGLRDVARL